MRIRLVNGDKTLSKYLQPVPFSEEADSLFIDWISTSSDDPSKAAAILVQTSSLEIAIDQKIPTILFDRYQSIATKEIKWLQKYNNIILCEPALVTRPGFIYMPFWVNILSLNDIQINDEPRPITLLYQGKIIDRIKSFENYYIRNKTYFPDITVVYNTEGLIQEKIDEYDLKGVKHTDKTYSDAQYTIAIGSDNDYKVGYLDPYIFKALEMGCVPFIPDEHRYYKGLPYNKPAGVMPASGIHWYLNQYEYSYLGLLAEFYECIDKYYPEMKVQHVVEHIYKLLSL